MLVRRTVAVLAAMAAVVFGGSAVTQAAPRSAPVAVATQPEAGPAGAQASCTKRNVSHYDAWTQRTWTADWVCGNRAGAPLHGCASFIPACGVIGWIDTSSSWFVCWGRGAQHSGGNNIWYYTQGDRSAPGEGGRQGWGFIPAVDVWTSTDPWPGMTECNIA